MTFNDKDYYLKVVNDRFSGILTSGILVSSIILTIFQCFNSHYGVNIHKRLKEKWNRLVFTYK